ncbi:MAG: DUF4304 domain-containing protein [Gemmatimonadota bacterium]|nr:DUF4304 domain-containing protein [Gemmatimonadota bacterium]
MTNPIESAVAEAFKRASFAKKSDTWYREASEAVLLANLQKSQFGGQYFLNLAVWVKALGEAKWPKEHQAHVRLRADSFMRSFPTELFDLEKSAGTLEKRQRRIEEVLSQEVLPLFLTLGTSEGLGDALRGGRLAGALIHKGVRDLLPAR